MIAKENCCKIKSSLFQPFKPQLTECLKILQSKENQGHYSFQVCSMAQGQAVQKVDNAIHQMNHRQADSMVCFVNTYPLDRNLSGR